MASLRVNRNAIDTMFAFTFSLCNAGRFSKVVGNSRFLWLYWINLTLPKIAYIYFVNKYWNLWWWNWTRTDFNTHSIVKLLIRKSSDDDNFFFYIIEGIYSKTESHKSNKSTLVLYFYPCAFIYSAKHPEYILKNQ